MWDERLPNTEMWNVRCEVRKRVPSRNARCEVRNRRREMWSKNVDMGNRPMRCEYRVEKPPRDKKLPLSSHASRLTCHITHYTFLFWAAISTSRASAKTELNSSLFSSHISSNILRDVIYDCIIIHTHISNVTSHKMQSHLIKYTDLKYWHMT